MAPTSDGATPHDHRESRVGPAPMAQWVGLLLAPVAFFVHLQVGYLLVLWDCGRDGGLAAVQASGVVALAVAGVGLWVAWRTWERAGREVPDDAPGAVGRTRLLAAAGIGVSSLMVLLLAAQLVSGFIVPRCQ